MPLRARRWLIGAAIGVAIIGRITPAAAEEARAQSDAGSADTVVLRDGRQIRGRLVQQSPDHWVVIETDDGRRHTYAWDSIAELDNGSAPRSVQSTAGMRSAWQRRSAVRLSHELRVTGSMLVLPEKTLGLTGYCSNTVSTSPASIYGNTARAQAVGFGGGVGGRLGFMHRSPPNAEGAISWWALRGGVGADVELFQLRAPLDIRPFQGELCTLVARMNHEVRYETIPFLVVQLPVHFGGAAALGRLVEPFRWKGVVVGAAWTPTLAFTGVFSSAGSTTLNPLSAELTVDFAVLVADGSLNRTDSHLRLALSGMAPSNNRQVAMLSLSVGIVYY